jgi:hypothetical protein
MSRKINAKNADKIMLTTVGLAAALGISRQRVNELGRLRKISREKDGRWDLTKVRAELTLNLDSSQAPRVRVQPSSSRDADGTEMIPGSSVHEVFNRARAAREVASAKIAQLDLRLREGELLVKAEVKEAWTQGANAFRNQLLLAPDRLAPKVAVCSDVRECRVLIEEEMRRILMIFSEAQADVA